MSRGTPSLAQARLMFDCINPAFHKTEQYVWQSLPSTVSKYHPASQIVKLKPCSHLKALFPLFEDPILPQPVFLKNLRTPIQPNTTYVVVYFLDAQGDFLYSPSHKKQRLIIRLIINNRTK